jgi:hypothetical protein
MGSTRATTEEEPMDDNRFEQSIRILANGAGRRDAVRSLGAIGLALLTALGLSSDDAASVELRRSNGNRGAGGRHAKNRDRDPGPRRGNGGQARGPVDSADGPAEATARAGVFGKSRGTRKRHRYLYRDPSKNDEYGFHRGSDNPVISDLQTLERALGGYPAAIRAAAPCRPRDGVVRRAARGHGGSRVRLSAERRNGGFRAVRA